MRALLPLLLIVLSSARSDAAQPGPACPPEARPPSPREIEDGKKNAKDRGFLWRARKDGRTSYLYGTIHVGKMEWMFPGPEVLGAVRASDLVALELDALDPDVLRRLQAGAARKPEHALPESLNQRLRAQEIGRAHV